MTISKVNVGTWAFGDKLTAAQVNLFDTKLITALDKTSAGDTLAGIVTLTTAGRILPSVTIGNNGDHTYTVGSEREIRVTSAVAADSIYTLSATGAQTNDVFTIWCDSGTTKKITVKDQAAATLITLGIGSDSEAKWAEFIYVGGWRLHMTSAARQYSETFTIDGSWVCPAGVTEVIIFGCGGGGGGGGGGDDGVFNNSGGGGGGGPIASAVHATVVPGTTYTVTVGTAGTAGAINAGAPGSAGGSGGATTFGSIARFLGAQGGTGGDVSTLYAYGGGPIARTAAVAAATDDDNQLPGQGGTGTGGSATKNGMPNVTGPSTGGAAGATAASGGGGGGGGNSGWPGGQGGAGGNGNAVGTAGAAGTLGGGGGGGGGCPGAGGTPAIGGVGGTGACKVTWWR